MSVGAELERLDPSQDTLANVNVFGESVACARFMGGRDLHPRRLKVALSGNGVQSKFADNMEKS